ncbi:hypothetical protein L3Q82_013467 [Scortum barcoo]|uniref:Uncharacterized protein n=1 Tax=Scortum barcoo TaxID=214431 RepID=A0ACB8W0C5_9TELE|nr:hypothetical protein L3Q82_013467 [Scortum barcoo]
MQKKARHIAADPTHPRNGLFVPLPSWKTHPSEIDAILWLRAGTVLRRSHRADKNHQKSQNNNLNLSNSPNMKTFSVAVALAVVLTFICLQESSAVLITEGQDLEEPMSDHHLIAAHEEMAEESWKIRCLGARGSCVSFGSVIVPVSVLSSPHLSICYLAANSGVVTATVPHLRHCSTGGASSPSLHPGGFNRNDCKSISALAEAERVEHVLGTRGQRHSMRHQAHQASYESSGNEEVTCQATSTPPQ